MQMCKIHKTPYCKKLPEGFPEVCTFDYLFCRIEASKTNASKTNIANVGNAVIQPYISDSFILEPLSNRPFDTICPTIANNNTVDSLSKNLIKPNSRKIYKHITMSSITCEIKYTRQFAFCVLDLIRSVDAKI